MASTGALIVQPTGLQALIDLLRADGWAVVGPTVRDGAVVHAEISSVDELPQGVGDQQDSGSYRLRERSDGAWFGFAVGPQGWKAQLFPSRELLWVGRRGPDGVSIEPVDEAPPRLALLGVRSCDLHAIAIHDQVLASRAVVDERYVARREATFVIAITCSDPGGTCFCVSMGTGPVPDRGYDLGLTELLEGEHRFLISAGSERGAEVLSRLEAALLTTDPVPQAAPATAPDHEAAAEVGARAATRMGRTMDTDGLRDLLYAKAESPHWDDVASRCLSCTNCTLVCPTCFCTSVEDTTDLTGAELHRTRVWDSCFTADFSYLHGGSVRSSVGSRYRQWATHKLAAWVDQFGSSGCVGCGRCITWCPATIDLTAEVSALRAEEA
jgi:formate hydrogenlyase subunit 6/NADH:ubiquinone oxidoreductase subunit I